jgi:spermidine synthase
MQFEPPSRRRLSVVIFLVALATLLLELALMRVLSFTIWHHFAYVILSTALLGFGAAGSLVAAWPQIGATDLPRALTRSSIGAGGSTLLALGVFAYVPVDPLAAAETASELLLLVVYLLLAAIPFGFAGMVVNLILRARAEDVHRLYFWDLLGAGLGCALSVVVMNALSPPGALLLAAALFLVATFPVQVGSRGRAAAGIAAALITLTISHVGKLPFHPAASKHLHGALVGLHMTTARTDWSALFRTDLLEGSDQTQYRPSDAWGLSPTAQSAQPLWGLVMHDGSAGTPVYDLREGRFSEVEDHILSYPYRIARERPRVLVIGVGGGRDILVARHHGARRVRGVELDPATLNLIQNVLAPQYGDFFHSPEIELVAGEGRHEARRSKERFDLIQLTGVDTVTAAASGAYVLAENYLYTVEAIEDFLSALEPRGILSYTVGHWDSQRPQVAGRILTVAAEALRARGATNPERHVALVNSRSMFVNLIVKNEPLLEAEVRRLRAEAERLEFEILALPDGGHSLYGDLLRLEGSSLERHLDSLPYDVSPVWDDNPFFFAFYRARDLFAPDDLGPAHNTALGQLVLVLLLVAVAVLALLIIVAPLALRRGWRVVRGRRGLSLMGYFLAVGVGFMFFEVSLLQRFIIYLGYPTYSLSVVLFTLLVAMGVGSALSQRWVGRERQTIAICVVLVAAMALGFATLLQPLQDRTLGLPLVVRASITVALLTPLGIVLGHFFPLGIRRAGALDPDMVSWAWAINGSASVVATIAAVILAMSIGFTLVWAAAVAIYALGAVALWVSEADANNRNVRVRTPSRS